MSEFQLSQTDEEEIKEFMAFLESHGFEELEFQSRFFEEYPFWNSFLDWMDQYYNEETIRFFWDHLVEGSPTPYLKMLPWLKTVTCHCHDQFPFQEIDVERFEFHINFNIPENMIICKYEISHYPDKRIPQMRSFHKKDHPELAAVLEELAPLGHQSVHVKFSGHGDEGMVENSILDEQDDFLADATSKTMDWCYKIFLENAWCNDDGSEGRILFQPAQEVCQIEIIDMHTEVEVIEVLEINLNEIK